MRLAAVLSLFIALTFAAGCADPCDKALKKMQKCWAMTQKKEENKADAAIFAQVCKLEKTKFEKCLKITDCAEYAKCLSAAAEDPRATTLLKESGELQTTPTGMTTEAPATGQPVADMPAAPADMPAAPADMPAEAPAAGQPIADMPAAPAADMPAAPADMPAAPADMK